MAVQAEITSAIVDRVEVALLPAERNRIHRSPSVDPEAYRAYLKGRFLWNKRTPEGFEAALKYFNLAVRRDRNFALAYSGLADTYGMMANYGVRPPAATFAEARSAATRALALDDSIAESHASLGMIYHSYDWNWAGAERANWPPFPGFQGRARGVRVGRAGAADPFGDRAGWFARAALRPSLGRSL